jgi:hypothetical protein
LFTGVVELEKKTSAAARVRIDGARLPEVYVVEVGASAWRLNRASVRSYASYETGFRKASPAISSCETGASAMTLNVSTSVRTPPHG